MQDSDRLKQELELYLVLIEPSEALPRLVKSAQDVYEYRSVLKRLPCTNETIKHLAKVVLNALESRTRFRKVECLKVLRAIIKNSNGVSGLESETVRFLFQVYKNVIFNVPEEGQWAASILIKGQILEDAEIHWLIQNYRQSIHPLNRLLLYPEYHPAIAAWAEDVYKAHELPNRETELIALFIQRDIPPFVVQTDTNQLIEAVSRARIPVADKEAFLMKLACPQNFNTLIDIALRLKMPPLIHYVIREIKKLQSL